MSLLTQSTKFQPGSPDGLYTGTMALELVSVAARWGLSIVIGYILYLLVAAPIALLLALPLGFTSLGELIIEKSEFVVYTLAPIISLAPYVFSLLTYSSVIEAGDNERTRKALGARKLSQAELGIFKVATDAFPRSAHQDLTTIFAQIKVTPKFFVIDNLSEVNAFTIGNAIYVTTGLIRSPYLPALLAHELGHFVNFDGFVILALRRLVFYPINLLFKGVGAVAPGAIMRVPRSSDAVQGCMVAGGLSFFLFLVALGGGGLGNAILGSKWHEYWQAREFAADLFAAECGQRDSLIAYLRKYQVFDIATPYFRSDKPYNEERIERLRAFDDRNDTV
jgi:Zn-dependent protease with chaperone function